ncbi:MAG: ABC transporter permease [Actinobacteria bacterium]|nr:ABC transporter permease [Actinomycetota bacterium]
MNATRYIHFELLRTFRNRRFFVFSLVFPLVLFFVIAGPNRNVHLGGLPFPTYYMGGMAAWGTMAAVIAGGARIALERQVGWNRQLRLTPLTPSTYLGAKVASGYALAAVSLMLIFAAGISLGVRPSAVEWLSMTGLIIVGLVPFAALGVYIGHRVSVDSMGPAMGGVTSLLALAGGAWGPIASHGFIHTVTQALPSYWLVRAGQAYHGGPHWPPVAWVVIGVWTIVLGGLAMRAYQRDTSRV